MRHRPPYIRPDAPYDEPPTQRPREETALRWLCWAMVVAVMALSVLIGQAIAEIQTTGEPYRPVGVPMTYGPPLTSAPTEQP